MADDKLKTAILKRVNQWLNRALATHDDDIRRKMSIEVYDIGEHDDDGTPFSYAQITADETEIVEGRH